MSEMGSTIINKLYARGIKLKRDGYYQTVVELRVRADKWYDLMDTLGSMDMQVITPTGQKLLGASVNRSSNLKGPIASVRLSTGDTEVLVP